MHARARFGGDKASLQTGRIKGHRVKYIVAEMRYGFRPLFVASWYTVERQQNMAAIGLHKTLTEITAGVTGVGGSRIFSFGREEVPRLDGISIFTNRVFLRVLTKEIPARSM